MAYVGRQVLEDYDISRQEFELVAWLTGVCGMLIKCVGMWCCDRGWASTAAGDVHSMKLKRVSARTV